jgi:hypothetical protein
MEFGISGNPLMSHFGGSSALGAEIEDNATE